MQAKKQPSHTFYNNAYFGQFQTVEVFGLQEIILGTESIGCFKDIRPFQTVERYLSKMGFKAGKTDEGEIVLVRHSRDGRKQARRISIARMLYLCRDKAREEQNEAKTSFMRMCAEEDEEELELVLELYHKGPKSANGARPAYKPDNEPKPVVVDLSDPDDWAAQEVRRVLVTNTEQTRRDAVPAYMLC